MRILLLTFYYKPDLCAGSFRMQSYTEALKTLVDHEAEIDVVTTMPNRYHSYNEKVKTTKYEKDGIFGIYRTELPIHMSGFIDQAKSFIVYFFSALKLVKNKEYDIVFASSSRLFTAFLGAVISRKKKIPLYLDIRDLFTDTMKSLLSKKISFFILPFLNIVERFTFNKASKINIVSGGFLEHIQAIVPRKEISVFMNGIDEDFYNIKYTSNPNESDKKIILYAGNIGLGQGLETIVPEALKKLDDKYEFWIVGDGGTKKRLKELTSDSSNIKLIPPVGREELIQYYCKADFLFLHLNDVDAFKKVLPSKIFEYASTTKPIIAGVKGFAAEFIRNNIENSIVFNPGDSDDLINKLDQYQYHYSQNSDFLDEFNRRNIMTQMGQDMLSIQNPGKVTHNG